MKSKIKMLLLIASLLSTYSAFAGTPDQDPVVDSLRVEFKHAKTPTVEQLSLGTTWVCEWNSAFADDYQKSGEFDVTLNSDGGAYVLRYTEIDDNNKDKDYEADYAYSKGALVARDPEWSGGMYFLRINAKGELMWERTTKDFDKDSQVASIASPGHGVANYGICPSVLVPYVPTQALIDACNRAIRSNDEYRNGDIFYSNDYYRSVCIQSGVDPSVVDACDSLNPGALGMPFPQSHQNRVVHCIINRESS